MEGFDLPKMKPANHIIKGGAITASIARSAKKGDSAKSAQASIRVLGDEGKAYAAYIKGGMQARLVLEIPAGSYQAQWIDPRDGKVLGEESLNDSTGQIQLRAPDYSEDIAITLVRK